MHLCLLFFSQCNTFYDHVHVTKYAKKCNIIYKKKCKKKGYGYKKKISCKHVPKKKCFKVPKKVRIFKTFKH